MISDNVGNPKLSRFYYQAALKIYGELGKRDGMASERIRLGVLEMRQGNYDKATDHYLKALDLSEAIGDKKGIMEANLTLGEVGLERKQYDLAAHYLGIAERLSEKISFSNLTLNLYNDLGKILTATGHFAAAKRYLEKGMALSVDPRYKGLNIYLSSNLAAVYAKEGNYAACIRLQKQALQKSRTIRNYLRELQALTDVATTYSRVNTDSALAYYRQARTLTVTHQAYRQQIDISDKLSGLYEKQKNFAAALDAKKEVYRLSEEFYYRRMSRQITDLKARDELLRSKVKLHEMALDNDRQALEARVLLGVILATLLLAVVSSIFLLRLRRYNARLREAYTALDHADQIKNKIFAVLGHDLRAPVISILNFLSLMDDDELHPEHRPLVDQLRSTTGASLDTLDSLLKWGEMQIKGVNMQTVVINVGEVTDAVLDLLKGSAELKSITIVNEVPPTLQIEGDLDHFRFVMRNLISNAIKFTPAGGQVSVSEVWATPPYQVAIAVRDNGVGMPPEKLTKIFELGNASQRGTGNEVGTSLGLHLCREFVEASGGRIRVDSQVGEGTQFTVEFQ